MTTPQQLATYLRQRPLPAVMSPWLHWPLVVHDDYLSTWAPPPPKTPPLTPEAVAEYYLADAEFHALNLAGWLSSPDGQLFAKAVSLSLVAPYSADFGVLVDGLRLAAELQQTPTGETVAGPLAFALVVLGAFAVCAIIWRGMA